MGEEIFKKKPKVKYEFKIHKFKNSIILFVVLIYFHLYFYLSKIGKN